MARVALFPAALAGGVERRAKSSRAESTELTKESAKSNPRGAKMKRLLALLLLSPTLAVASPCFFGPGPCQIITSGSGTLTVQDICIATDVITGGASFERGPACRWGAWAHEDSSHRTRPHTAVGRGLTGVHACEGRSPRVFAVEKGIPA
jgi:hypothetical protein